ncbi:glycosyltransferase family 2 protein [Peptostreptococcus equinus]|uniref:Glycosyltransferase family 2 protein n=1 Tax=Peptostreptococcus equinus TaxID=3003601 RepID=A0ABY7JSS0_9FIRM|nr:glycosyltransferase family 2 protein [Peptostreptococcus sp. CBA3647]WAW15526.1 glycosyltransferase family 2 protein [Peptostreptococcus sp. CBA3647]
MIDGLISIITPIYNADKHIEETVASVLKQTYTNFELLLIDDCSTDKSSEIIGRLIEKDNRIKYIKLKQNSGAAVARNIGLSKAKGRYVAFLDSDDLWKENKLKKQIELLDENNVAFCFTSYRYFYDADNITSKVARAPEKIDYEGLLKNTLIGCSSVMIDREIIGDFKMPEVRKGQDTATWLKLLRQVPYAYGIYDDLVYYRVANGSLSSNKSQALRRTWYTYRNIEKLPLLKAIYVFIFYAFNAFKRRVKNEK